MRALHRRGVLDMNTVIGLPRIVDVDALPAKPAITAITLAVLAISPLAASDETERIRRQAHPLQAEGAAPLGSAQKSGSK